MAHLHLHTNYSVIDGRGTIEDYLKLAKADGQESMAITDHGTLGGIIEGYTLAHKEKYDINLIAGMELYVDVVELRERNYPGHLTVLARNERGYRALIAANNLAHRQFYYRPRVTIQQLLDGGYTEDWIILSGCMSSPINYLPYTDAEIIVKQLAAKSGGFFLEAMWHYSEDEAFLFKQDTYLNRVADLHKATGIPITITNDCHFAHEGQEKIHLDLLKHSHSEVNDLEFDGEDFHFKSTKKMQFICDNLGIPNAWDNAVEIGKSCHLVIPEADNINWYVPDITGGRPYERLREIADPVVATLPGEYQARYEYELAVLATSPAILNSYLVTWDVVNWCRERAIPVAARGSMAGSLVSWLLDITKEDPIKYRLSFSRAVNPARPTIPDFDLDVSSIYRGDILDYLKERYEGNIPIAAYTSYGPKGAFRKVLRMEGLHNPTEINELCKPLPEGWSGGDFTYNERAKVYQGSAPWTENVPDKYRDYVAIYQGLYSTMSVHPSGVLVSGPERELENEIPFQWVASSQTLTSAYDMYSLKKIGLFKLDVLGLRTLDQLAYMYRTSKDYPPNDDYDEPEVLQAFTDGYLAEIFQMDGYACKAVLKGILGVKTFEDIIAANTLARPGCAQFTPYYRSGYENLLREYPSLEDILRPTNGLILYQEQVMEIARVLADFDDAEQDDVKEAIKYFQHDVWSNTIEPLFRKRCEAKGIEPTNILQAISKMASYTYNRAHAMTYAAIAYKMMWYKVHYPTIYYAAVYDAAAEKDKLVLESHRFGVKWSPPDVNRSQSQTVVEGDEILLGLSTIKGVGPAAVEALSAVRPFDSMDDMMARVERRKCNVKVIKALKEAFALNCIGEGGSYPAFNEAFGFHYQYMNPQPSFELTQWNSEQWDWRLGGFLVNLKPTRINKEGPNQGKEMAHLTVVNIFGSHDGVVFPDAWRKLKGTLYEGAAVKLTGRAQQKGGFVVEDGVTV